MTLDHEHKLPELSVILTAELAELRRKLRVLQNTPTTELFRLQIANAGLRTDVQDLHERLSSQAVKLAHLDAGRTADAATICNYREKTEKLQRQLEFTVRDRQKHGDRADWLQAEVVAQRNSNSAWRERALGAERLASERQGVIYEMEQNGLFGHQCWLQGQLDGPGLELPDGTYNLGSNANGVLTIKLEKR